MFDVQPSLSCELIGDPCTIASGPIPNGKVKDLGVSDATMQNHVAPLELGQVFERDALVAAMLNDEVLMLPRAGAVPINGDGGLNGTVRELAVSNGDALCFGAAGVLPEGKKVLRLVLRVGTEIEMVAQAETADLGYSAALANFSNAI